MIRQPGRYVAAIVMLVFALVTALVVTLSHGTHDGADWKLPAGFSALTLLCAWFGFVLGKREVRIDGDAGVVTLSRSSMLLTRKTQTWPLSQFDTVRSYLRSTKTSTFSILELASTTSSETIELAFPAGRGQPSWFIPYPGEADEVRALRSAIASRFGLRDGGFNTRMASL